MEGVEDPDGRRTPIRYLDVAELAALLALGLSTLYAYVPQLIKRSGNTAVVHFTDGDVTVEQRVWKITVRGSRDIQARHIREYRLAIFDRITERVAVIPDEARCTHQILTEARSRVDQKFLRGASETSMWSITETAETAETTGLFEEYIRHRWQLWAAIEQTLRGVMVVGDVAVYSFNGQEEALRQLLDVMLLDYRIVVGRFNDGHTILTIREDVEASPWLLQFSAEEVPEVGWKVFRLSPVAVAEKIMHFAGV